MPRWETEKFKNFAFITFLDESLENKFAIKPDSFFFLRRDLQFIEIANIV